MSTKIKLILATVGCVVIVCIVVVAHHLGASNARIVAEDFRNATFPELLALQDMRFGVVRIVASTSELLLARVAGAENEAAETGERELIEQGRAIFADALRRYSALYQGPVKAQAKPHEEPLLPKVAPAYDALLKTSQDLIALSEHGAPIDEIVELKEVFETRERAILEIIDIYYSVESGLADQAVELTIRTIDEMTLLSTVLGAIAIAILVSYGIFVLGVMRSLMAEVSERKRAEETLRESEEKLRSIMDHSPFIIALKDTEGRYVTANKFAFEAFGRTKEEVIGKTACSAPGSLDTSLSHAAGLIEIAACHA